MIITSVQIRKFDNTGNKMKGVCTLVLDELIAIHDIKILMKPREEGLFFAMPSKKVFTGANTERFVDIVHPINRETREKLEEIIFPLYRIIENDLMVSIIRFVNTNTACTNLLEQKAADFKIEEKTDKDEKPVKPIAINKQVKTSETKVFNNEEMKNKIEAWLSE